MLFRSLVSVYNNKSTPNSLKMEIIRNPLTAADNIKPASIKKHNDNISATDAKFESSLRLMIKLVAELEANISGEEKEKLLKYSGVINALSAALERFLKLISHFHVSPGKLTQTSMGKGGHAHGNC